MRSPDRGGGRGRGCCRCRCRRRPAVPSLLLPLVVLIGGCALFAYSIDAPPTKNFDRCVEPDEVDVSIDYFPEKVAADDAVNWSITYHNTYKILRNLAANTSYLLYQCGIDPPSHEIESGDHRLALPVPFRGGVVLTQTTQIPHVELLGLRRDIKAFAGGTNLVSSPCLGYMLDEGMVHNVYDPDDPWNSTRKDELVDEYLKDVEEMRPVTGDDDDDEGEGPIVLEGPYGDADGVRRIVISESKEKTGGATFEWHEYYSALFNLEGMASRTVEDAKERHECARSNAALLTSDLPPESRPKVLWAYWSTSAMAWDVAECPNYYCEYASDCGTTLLSRPDGVGSISDKWGVYLTDEELVEHAGDADVWIYPAPGWDGVYAERRDALDRIKAVGERKVYDYQGRGSNGWFEQRLAEYDVVLLDFCNVAGTADPNGVHKRQFLRDVFTESVGDEGTCGDDPDEMVDVPYVSSSAASECELLTPSSRGVGGSSAAAAGTRIRRGTAQASASFVACAVAAVIAASSV